VIFGRPTFHTDSQGRELEVQLARNGAAVLVSLRGHLHALSSLYLPGVPGFEMWRAIAEKGDE
jgi:hypothetical protein